METKTSKDFDPITWANFQKNLVIGQQYEEKLMTYLINNGYSAYSSSSKEYDIKYTYTASTEEEKTRTLELKTDFVANKTNNIFIETFQNGYESGINTTKAKSWCTTIVNTYEEKNKCICVNTKSLKKYIDENKDKLRPATGHQSEGYLIPIFSLITELKNKIFYV